jgi:hypothetical protein
LKILLRWDLRAALRREDRPPWSHIAASFRLTPQLAVLPANALLALDPERERRGRSVRT